ncbi:MAG: Rid family hydrolase [Rikenellaceae bacterium]
MRYRREIYDRFSTVVESALFAVEGGEVEEQNIMIHSTNHLAPFDEQLAGVVGCFEELCNGSGCYTPIFVRVFVSDAANQISTVEKSLKCDCPISIIEQPPLDGSKIAVWCYLQSGVVGSKTYKTSHNGYTHIWSTSVANPCVSGSQMQTEDLLTSYVEHLRDDDCSLLDNTIRTWFFVQNVDVNYGGVVVGRNNVFDREGLVVDSHFIASTGIGGRVGDHRITTIMDAYSVKGISAEQMQYLYGSTHLNSTAEYGVRFERGTAVHYGDRSHIFISGTASINNRGEVVHVGDIRKQTLRMWENVEVLLREAESSFEDVAQIIVYLRDISDYVVARGLFDERFANIPTVFVYAPVCRPTWLIEMECLAIRQNRDERFRKF